MYRVARDRAVNLGKLISVVGAALGWVMRTVLSQFFGFSFETDAAKALRAQQERKASAFGAGLAKAETIDEVDALLLPEAGQAREPHVAADFKAKLSRLVREGGYLTAGYRDVDRWQYLIAFTLEEPGREATVGLWLELPEGGHAPFGSWRRELKRANGSTPRQGEGSIYRLDWTVASVGDIDRLFAVVVDALLEVAGRSPQSFRVRFDFMVLASQSAWFCLGVGLVPIVGVATAITVGVILLAGGMSPPQPLNTAVLGAFVGILLSYGLMNAVGPMARAVAPRVGFVRRGMVAEEIMGAVVLVGPVVLTVISTLGAALLRVP